MAFIAAHVQQQVTTGGVLEAQGVDGEALVTIMDALAAAVFVVEADARLKWRNPAAAALIAGGDFVVRNGVLSANDADGQASFRAALAKGGGRPAFFALQAPSGSLIAALLPVRASAPFVIVVNRQTPDHPNIGTALTQAFGVTRRELSVLMPLLRGQSIEAAAAELGIEVATARSHLHKLFTKTETTRQGELIQKVLALLPPVALKA